MNTRILNKPPIYAYYRSSQIFELKFDVPVNDWCHFIILKSHVTEEYHGLSVYTIGGLHRYGFHINEIITGECAPHVELYPDPDNASNCILKIIFNDLNGGCYCFI